MCSHSTFSVAVVGHSYSYIRYLRDHCSSRQRWHNLGIPLFHARIHWLSVGGASLRQSAGSRSAYSFLDRLHQLAPDVVYIHIGENDLDHLSSLEMVSAIVDFVCACIHACRPKIVIVIQITLFLIYQRRYANKLHSVNSRLERNSDTVYGDTRIMYLVAW